MRHSVHSRGKNQFKQVARNENDHKLPVLNLKNMNHKLFVVRSYSYNALFFAAFIYPITTYRL